jgi:diguanylate cyclase (GGDEF)-like protein/PAS domain S-box-containing protein
MLARLVQEEKFKFTKLLSFTMAAGSGLLGVFAWLGIGSNVPAVPVLIMLTAALTFLGFLARRHVALAPALLPWFTAIAVPMVLVGDAVSKWVDTSLFLAPTFAILLSDRKTLMGIGVLQIAIMTVRGNVGVRTPYLEASFLLVYILTLFVFSYLNGVFAKALNDVVQTRTIAGAVSFANDDLVVLRELDGKELGPVGFVSDSVGRVLGFSKEQFIALNVGMDLIHDEDRDKVLGALAAVLRQESRNAELEARVRNASGTWKWYHGRVFDLRDDPSIRGVITVLRDVDKEVEARKQHHEELRNLARRDALTGLPNRRSLNTYLTENATECFAVLVCDFDGFKNVNDTLGHDVGDELLVLVSARLATHVNEATHLYRLGGDEFVFVVQARGDGDLLSRSETLAQALIEESARPVTLANQAPLVLTLSAGIALQNPDGATGEPHYTPFELLRNADLAMYAAKEAGKHRFQKFDARMRTQAERRHRLEQALRTAVAGSQFHIVYQPKLDTRTGVVVGFEALARWNVEPFGQVSPQEFIPIAEETGLIVALGEQVLHAACMEAVRWRAGTALSVNLSPSQIAEEERLIASVEGALRASGLAPHLLELEVTESVFIRKPEATIRTLSHLRSLGVTIAVDDFGTGYSSLAYLRRFPVNTLKVDRSFVEGIDTNAESRIVVAAVISLAKKLKMLTIAEGVETEAGFRVLAELGCDQVQGFLFAKGMSAELARSFEVKSALFEHGRDLS